MTADDVAYRSHAKKGHAPVNPFQAKIDTAKNQQEQIQGKPDDGLPDVGEKIVKKVIGPDSVDLVKKPEIQIYNTLQDIH